MYLRDDVGPREAQHVNVVAQGTRMILEAFAAEVLFGQALALDEDAHGPVEDDDALPEQLVQPVSNRIRLGQGTIKSTDGPRYPSPLWEGVRVRASADPQAGEHRGPPAACGRSASRL